MKFLRVAAEALEACQGHLPTAARRLRDEGHVTVMAVRRPK